MKLPCRCWEAGTDPNGGSYTANLKTQRDEFMPLLFALSSAAAGSDFPFEHMSWKPSCLRGVITLLLMHVSSKDDSLEGRENGAPHGLARPCASPGMQVTATRIRDPGACSRTWRGGSEAAAVQFPSCFWLVRQRVSSLPSFIGDI